jgi:uncharacterized membrane protein YdjX (TVP38/TMEM64 family)
MNKQKIVGMMLLLVAVGIGFLFLPVKAWALALQSWIQGLGLFGPLVFVVIYVIATVFLIPGSALTLVAGAIFGLWLGAATVIVGANLGALVAFLLAKTKLRAKVNEWAAENPKFAALDRAIGQNGFKMVLLTRLSPAFPFTLLNYFLGLTSVRTGAYVLANFLGMLPATFLYVYFGSLAGATLTTTDGANTFQWALRIIGLLATLAVVVFVTRAARKAMAEVEGEQHSDALPATEVR